jgi:hypothetical protein
VPLWPDIQGNGARRAQLTSAPGSRPTARSGDAKDKKSAPKRAPPGQSPRGKVALAQTFSRPHFRASARISAAIRATVAFPVPTSRAGLLIPAPAFREGRTAASRSADSRGRPKAFPLLVPFARALARYPPVRLSPARSR